MNVEILEVGLEREFSFLDRKKKLQKKMFCRPTDPKVFSQWTRNRGTFFLALISSTSNQSKSKNSTKNEKHIPWHNHAN